MSLGFGCNHCWLIRVLARIENSKESEENREEYATVVVAAAC